MEQDYYDFDEESIDELYDEGITLDNWKPSEKKQNIIKSNWRKQQIGNNFNQAPGLDEVRKIKRFIKSKYPEHEIMETFGINAETLTAIRKKRYCPVDGISFDNLSKISMEFEKLEKYIIQLKRQTKYLSSKLFSTKEEISIYRNFYLKTKKAKKNTFAENVIIIHNDDNNDNDESLDD